MNTVNIPGFTAESSLNRMRGYSYSKNAGDPQQSHTSQVTPQACIRRCRDVIRPELCFWVPFPFCLMPQHECRLSCS